MDNRRRNTGLAVGLALVALSGGCTDGSPPGPTPSSKAPRPTTPGTATPTPTPTPGLEDPLATTLAHADADYLDIIDGVPLLHEHGTGPQRYVINDAKDISAVHVFTACAGKGSFRTGVDGRNYSAACDGSVDASATVPLDKAKNRLDVLVTVDRGTEFWVVAFAAKRT